MVRDTDSEGDVTYRPVIEFQTGDGQTYRITARIATGSPPEIGSGMEVLYDPADPAGATEKTFTNLWLFPIVFVVFGMVLFVISRIAAAMRARRAVENGARRPPGSVPTTAPAEFRRAEAAIGDDGTMKYRIVAKDDAGNEYYSELLDEDPTVAIMERGNQVRLVERRGRWLVDLRTDED